MDGLGGAHAQSVHTPPNVCIGKVALPLPTSPSGQLFVTIPSHGVDKWGPISWRPNGSRLPAEGDEALIAFDERAMPWLIEWTATTSFDPPLVSALPSAPYDGQPITYQNEAMAAAGVAWRLRYRAASASAHKWEFVGGAWLYEAVDTDESTASATYVALTTAGPSATVPLGGDYLITVGSNQYNSASANSCWHSFSVGAEAAVDTDAGNYTPPAINVSGAGVAVRRKANLAAETAVVSKYRASAGTAHFRSRWMSVQPVRLG